MIYLVGYSAKRRFPQDEQRFRAIYTNNLGNWAFVEGLKSIIFESTHLPQNFDFSALQSKDLIVLPMANHLSANVDLWERYPTVNKTSQTKIIVVLGIQSDDGMPEIPVNSEAWIKKLSLQRDNISNIWTRGPITSEFLRSLGIASDPLGCPSLFLNKSDTLGKEIETCISELLKTRTNDRLTIGVTGGKPLQNNKKKQELERQLIDVVLSGKNNKYIVQAPESLLFSIYDRPLAISPQMRRFQQICLPAKTDVEALDFFKNQCVGFLDIFCWLFQLKKFDLIFGTRIHGVQLGLQAGVPSVLITTDRRTEELADSLMVPNIRMNELTSQGGDLLETCLDLLKQFDGAFYDEQRKIAASKVLKFLAAWGIRADPQFKTFALD